MNEKIIVRAMRFFPVNLNTFEKLFFWLVTHLVFTQIVYRLIAVRETGVSRHHGGSIEGPPETPRTSQHYHFKEMKIKLSQCAPMSQCTPKNNSDQTCSCPRD